MTREEAISIMKVIVHMLEEKYDTDRVEDAVDMAIKALSAEPCEDCISRAEAIKAIRNYNVTIEVGRAIGKSQLVDIVDSINKVQEKMISELPSIQPTTKENLVVGDCISREFIEIVVNYPPADLCTYSEYRGKPYYSILYRDEDSRNHVGFGTYKIEMLSQWIKEYFMPSIQPKPKTRHWIEHPHEAGENWEYPRYECSECNVWADDDSDYCPNCGARMVEPQESEEI